MILLSLTLSALAQESSSDADVEIYQRLMSEPTGQAQAQSIAAPWWIWPLGMLGMLGAAGVVLRTRNTDGIPGDIKVISRTGLSRTASLAMIEVIGSDGKPRRMLVGVGGGAPRLVADLSEKIVSVSSTVRAEASRSRGEVSRYRSEAVWTGADVDLVQESATEATPVIGGQQARPAPTAPVVEPSMVGQHLSVSTPEDPQSDSGQKLSPIHAPHASAMRVYGSQKSKASAESLDLVAQVLAERGNDKSAPEAKSDWNDPWAENFEALLARRTV